MKNIHGMIIFGGQSLDGVAYERGDEIILYDDGRNDNSRDEVRVRNNQRDRDMVVLVTAVCWMPTHYEARDGGGLAFTIYGHRTALRPPRIDSPPSYGNGAIRAWIGSCHYIIHTIVAESDTGARAHPLGEPERQALFTYQWNSQTADWPTQDLDDLIAAFVAEDGDAGSDGGLSMATTNPSVDSPTTPAPITDQDGMPRRDSAVEITCQSRSKVSHNLVCFPVDMPPSNLNPYLVSSEAKSPARYGGAMPLPTLAEELTVGGGATIQSVPLVPYGATAVAHRLGENDMPEHMLEPVLAPMRRAARIQATQDPAYLYHPGPVSSGHPAQEHQPQRYEAAGNNTTWSQQSATGPQWSPYPSTGGYHAAQQSGQTAMPGHANQQNTPRGHTSMPLPALSEHGHYLPPSPYVAPGHYNPLTYPRYDDRPTESFDSYGMASNTSPAFHRTQERQTVGLTAPGQQADPAAWGSQQSSGPGHNRTPVPPSAPVNARQSPQQPTSAFRPELIVNLFTHEIQPHIDALQTRQREQQEEVLAPDQLASPSVTETLELVRNAATVVLETLRTLRPGSMATFHLTEKRIRDDVESIVTTVQNIRQTVLAGNPLPEQDQRILNQQTQGLISYIRYLGDVFSDMVERPNLPAPAASTRAPSQQSSSGPTTSSGPRASNRPRANNRHHAYSRPQANNRPQANPVSGMAMNREHQRLLRQLADDVAPPQQPGVAVNTMPPASGPVHPAPVTMMPTPSVGPPPVAFQPPPVWADPPLPTMVDPAMSMVYPPIPAVSTHSSPYLAPAVDPNTRAQYLVPDSAGMATTLSAQGAASTAHTPVAAHSPHSLVMSPMPMPGAQFDRRSSLPGRPPAQHRRERERQRAAPYPQSYRGPDDRKDSV